ncbi:MAG: aldo/keto reductase [Clostridia bacterium]|nr:aldo/keto reductase [Clostridia bacterium]
MKKLGFGLMRLPLIGEEIDMEQVRRMVDAFMEAGFTYFDTAYGYHGGMSEVAAREALVKRYPRESFTLATKLPAFVAKSESEAKLMLDTSLERAGVDFFDYYLLHNVGNDRTKAFEDYGIWEYVARKKREGVIRNMGFSFHDSAKALDEILTRHPEVDFVQLQINYADWESPAVQSRLCYETARKHGKPVVIMEPVKGGSLAIDGSEASKILKSADTTASLASWGIRFAASLEGVMVVLSGMSNMEQMLDNVGYMRDFKPLDEGEMKTIEKARLAIEAVPSTGCTSCGYCLPGCPSQIAINGIFRALDNYLVFGNMKGAKGNYQWETRLGGVASKCVGCGQCESVCPQHVHIIDNLAKARELFEGA